MTIHHAHEYLIIDPRRSFLGHFGGAGSDEKGCLGCIASFRIESVDDKAKEGGPLFIAQLFRDHTGRSARGLALRWWVYSVTGAHAVLYTSRLEVKSGHIIQRFSVLATRLSRQIPIVPRLGLLTGIIINQPRPSPAPSA